MQRSRCHLTLSKIWPKEPTIVSTAQKLISKLITPAILKLADNNRKKLPKPQNGNVYLSGVNAPVDGEVTESDLHVTGEIPAELNGSYIRIGANPIVPPDLASHHWFLGDGMMHGVRLRSGSAPSYRRRYIRSNAASAALNEAPAPGDRSPFSDLVNTNVMGHAGQIWALVEAGSFPVRINEDLDTIAHDPFGGSLTHGFSAHPHRDPATGEMHAICYSATSADTIYHVVVDTKGCVRREEPISVQHGPMIHDCMITENYVIILDLPVTFSMKLLIKGFGFPYTWNPAHKARVGLLPKDGTNADVIWCDISPCFAFHPANAFENDDGTVTMDLCVHDTVFAQSTMGPDSDATPFERWHIDPAVRQVSREVIDKDPQEFPRINEAKTGQPYRYAYAAALPDGFANAYPDASAIYKHDLQTHSRETHDFGAGRLPSEFVFVPREVGRREDDGWMMGYVTNMREDRSEFVILDAANFSSAPVATVHIPHRMPTGFHGNWVPR